MAKAFSIALFAFFVIQATICGCPEGWTDLDSSGRSTLSATSDADCFQCQLGCKKCSTDGSCDDMIDLVDGAEIVGALVVGYCGSTYDIRGYNPENEECDTCMTGCNECYLDYDLCTNCQVGWDYNRAGRSCLRATLGLAATNMCLAIVVVVGAVLTCLKASKLS